ncbi:MAG TPA: hypothetical protein VE868_07045 [Balneolaceae bacterium]|nr:hypothetical protein [Balneolaceae bacterium]
MRFSWNINRLLGLVVLTGLVPVLSSCIFNNHTSRPPNTYACDFQTNAAIQADTALFHISPDSTITAYNFSVQSGSSLVFRYNHQKKAPDHARDAGFSETLVFRIPTDVKKFDYQDKNFSQADVFYQRSCACSISGAGFKVTSGLIRGERLSPVHWIIRVNVTVHTPDGDFHLKFNRPFYEKNLL